MYIFWLCFEFNFLDDRQIGSVKEYYVEQLLFDNMEELL